MRNVADATLATQRMVCMNAALSNANTTTRPVGPPDQAGAAPWPWWWVVVIGAVVGLVVSPLVDVVAAAYTAVLTIAGPLLPGEGRAGRWAAVLAAWAVPGVGLLLVTAAAAIVARRFPTRPVLMGMLLGAVATLSAGMLALTTGGTRPSAFAGLAIVAGLAGGVIGSRPPRGRDALYRASRAIAAARSPAALLVALGEEYAAPSVDRITLWRVETSADDPPLTRLRLSSRWERTRGHPGPARALPENAIMPPPDGLTATTPVVVETDHLTAEERERWGRLGGRATLMAPLVSAGGGWRAVLMVETNAEGGFGGAAVRAYLGLAAQVGVALDNLDLLDQVRRAAVRDERQRMAREIHDTLAQGFTSIVMQLEAAEGALDRAGLDVARQHIDQARLMARESLAESRRLVWALRPESLERDSLPDALSRLGREWSDQTGVAAEVVVTGQRTALHPEVEVTLLRAAQEGLNNVRRHARATAATITLSYLDDVVLLDVHDNGAGFDPDRPAGESNTAGTGFGLMAMQQRVAQLGGVVTVESAPGEGTTVAVEIPIGRDHEAQTGEEVGDDGAGAADHRG
jgi:signal transduction histidine kinase